MRQIGDRDLELAALLQNGIDARFDQAAAGGLVRRGFDLGLGGKGDRKALVRVLVFPPALRTGWGACGNYGDDEGDEAHFLCSQARFAACSREHPTPLPGRLDTGTWRSTRLPYASI